MSFLITVVLCLPQASDMINAILEGYPKSKKEFLVSKKKRTFTPCPPPKPLSKFIKTVPLSQDEVGVETDEDCKAVLPST